MFKGCILLTSAPALPSLNIPDSCYNSMFEDCTSLTAAPTLSSTDYIGEFSYSCMFKGCTSLTAAPTLPSLSICTYGY